MNDSVPVTVRILSPGDTRILNNVAPDVFDNAIRADSVAQFLADPNSALAVAIDNGVVVGMASSARFFHPDKLPQLFINEVGVAPSHRCRGIGQRLVEQLLGHARDTGCAEAWVGTEVDNVAARTLYNKAGGAEDESPAIIYTWDLSH